MNILMVGDVYGEPGRQAVAKLLPRLRQEHAIDFAVVNVENAAGGFGVTAPIARQILEAGVRATTPGEPTPGNSANTRRLNTEKVLLRPRPFSPRSPPPRHTPA